MGRASRPALLESYGKLWSFILQPEGYIYKGTIECSSGRISLLESYGKRYNPDCYRDGASFN